MWENYAKGKYGVAIQSTYGNLKHSFSLGNMVYIGEVQYINHERDTIPLPLVTEDGTIHFTIITPFMYKKHEYETDKELRALIVRAPEIINTDPFCGKGGGYVRVDLGALIEKVYVSPRAPSWFRDLVECVLKKYCLSEKEVVPSSLDKKPSDI